MEENEKISRKVEIEDDTSSKEEVVEEENAVIEDAEAETSGEELEEVKAEETCEEKLSQAHNKIDELQDRYVRVHAELENFKKRTRREVGDFKKYAVEAIVKQLLPVFDNLERALWSVNSSEDAGSSQITAGIEMTLKEIERVFDQFSIKAVDASGQKFDPAYHMAVGQEERDDMDENMVVNQFQKGYMLHDRLLRPAMVIVSKAKTDKQNITDSQEENKEVQQ